jgi:hypothetical protein
MGKTFKRVATGLAATAVAVTMMGTIGTTPAFAGTNTSIATLRTASYALGAGIATFLHEGEHLTIEDTKADGAGVRIYWAVTDPRGNVYENGTAYVGGAGESKNVNLSVTEGHGLSFTLCVSDNGNRIQATCSTSHAIA